jgi:HEPN domain-containing protein
VAAINAGELQIKVSANTDDIKAMKSELSKLKGSTKSAQQGFGGLSKTLGSSIGKFVGIGAAIAGAGLALRGLSNGLKQSIAAFNSQQRAEAQLNAVLKSTKGAAGLTANEIKKLGSEIQRTTEFEDDMVIKSSSLLLTFTKISKDTFPRAQRAIADMAAAMGTDLQAATIQVGKAMNDVKLGISALSRVGIQFSEEQKDLINTLDAAGRTAEAQGIILAELETQFGGAAAAIADTFGGSINQLKNNVGDLQEAMGALIAEATQPLIDNTNSLVQSFKDMIEVKPSKEMEAQRVEMLALSDVVQDTTTSENIRLAALNKLRKINPEVVNDVNDLATGMETLRKNTEKVNQSMIAQIAIAGAGEEVAKVQKKAARDQLEAAQQRVKVQEALRGTLTQDVGTDEANRLLNIWREQNKTLEQQVAAANDVIDVTSRDTTAIARGNIKLLNQELASYTAVTERAARSQEDLADEQKNLETVVRELNAALNLPVNGFSNEIDDGSDSLENALLVLNRFKTNFDEMTATVENGKITWVSTFETIANKSAEAADKLEQGLGKASQVLGQIQSVATTGFEIASSVFSELTERQNTALAEAQQDQLDAIDAQFEAELERRGLAEETKLEQLQREFESFTEQINATGNERKKANLREQQDDLKKEIEKTKIKEKYEDARDAKEREIAETRHAREVEIFNFKKKMDVTQIILQGLIGQAVAFVNAVRDLGFPAGPIVGGITAGLIIAQTAASAALVNSKPAPPKPRFQFGTLSAPGGTAIVGEAGPEAVDIPKGARVRTADETRELLNPTINVGVYIDSENVPISRTIISNRNTEELA